MNKLVDNFVVVNLNTNKMEASFSNKLDSINYSIMLHENRGLNIQILKVDDKALGRYLLDFRTDDVFLNKEVIFDTYKDYELYKANILKTSSFDFDAKENAKILDSLVSEYKDNINSSQNVKEVADLSCDSKKPNKMR